MNLLCPNCQKMLSVAEQFAGQTMKCPSCAGTFTVPAPPPGGFAAAPPPPMPTPSFGSSAAAPPSPSFGSKASAPPAPPPAGFQHAFSLSLRREFLNFLAPVSLLLVFFLMFFPWVESGVTGKDGGAFSGWQTAFGEYSSALGLIHALFFILTLLGGLAAAALAFVPVSALPPNAQRLTPLVPAAVGFGALLCLLLLVLQVVGGFGPELDPEKVLKTTGVEFAGQIILNFAHTFWLRLAVFFEILAIVGCTLTLWLGMRGNQQPPRIDFNW